MVAATTEVKFCEVAPSREREALAVTVAVRLNDALLQSSAPSTNDLTERCPALMEKWQTSL